MRARTKTALIFIAARRAMGRTKQRTLPRPNHDLTLPRPSHNLRPNGSLPIRCLAAAIASSRFDEPAHRTLIHVCTALTCV